MQDLPDHEPCTFSGPTLRGRQVAGSTGLDQLIGHDSYSLGRGVLYGLGVDVGLRAQEWNNHSTKTGLRLRNLNYYVGETVFDIMFSQYCNLLEVA